MKFKNDKKLSAFYELLFIAVPSVLQKIKVDICVSCESLKVVMSISTSCPGVHQSY